MTEYEKAIANAIPEKPIEHELGGGTYYTCHWIKCGNTLHKWDRYCSKCGQKILWDEEIGEAE